MILRRNKVITLITITKDEFLKLSDYIKVNYGIDIKQEKQSLLTDRLQSVLIQKHFSNFTEYYNYLITDETGEAATTLVSRISTNHTFFMREPQHFTYFQDIVLPYLKGTVKSRDLRIWSAGCSSGEEAYTLAMIIDEFFGAEKKLWDTKILATDISDRVLNQAREGVYSNKEISALPLNWKLNNFVEIDGENSAIADRLKNEVIYRRFNLMNQVFSFRKKFHVIFCRNVMIYFDSETTNELVKKFYDLTEPGGYLFIGHSESLNREETKYKFIMPSVYRKV